MATQPSEQQQRGKHSPYERLKAAILDGTLAPGSQLVESWAAQWCGVSRTPIREALTRLQQDGLLQRGDRGLVVRERSPEEILDIYEVRIVLETMAAGMAAERHTAFDRRRLQRLLKTTATVKADDSAEMFRANREFHNSVWLATHNEALVDLLTRLNLHLVRYPATTLSFPGRWERALREHAELIDALLQRDAARARLCAESHFTQARDIRLELWDQV